ncbi:hypothetical protein VPHK460_0080 [Vibrio phage K460]
MLVFANLYPIGIDKFLDINHTNRVVCPTQDIT